MENKSFIGKLNKFLMKDETFILLIAGLASAVFTGTYLYIKFGTGAFSDISVLQMLSGGMETGDYTSAAGFAAGFLVARVLEGPLVGLLDIGGSIMTGVGIGIPALLLSMGIEMPFSSLPVALLCGAVIGLLLGVVIIVIRKLVPQGVSVGGTSIMMGAGNSCGRYLGPMIVISACSYNPWTGIGAIIGSVIFYKLGKQITGGAILGAMLLGAFFL